MLKNIIYISHAEKYPSGGAKIIYRHSEKINTLKNFSSEVLHLKKTRLSKLKTSIKKKIKLNTKVENGWQLNEVTPVKKFNYKWFKHKIKNRNNFNFDKKKDFIIFPEIFAHFAKNTCFWYHFGAQGVWEDLNWMNLMLRIHF